MSLCVAMSEKGKDKLQAPLRVEIDGPIAQNASRVISALADCLSAILMAFSDCLVAIFSGIADVAQAGKNWLVSRIRGNMR